MLQIEIPHQYERSATFSRLPSVEEHTRGAHPGTETLVVRF